MSSIQQVLVAVIGVAMVTTLVLPKRQTPAVFNALGNAGSSFLGTAMGTR